MILNAIIDRCEQIAHELLKNNPNLTKTDVIVELETYTMRFYSCKCGKMTSWGSMSPPACLGCEECGSNLATGPTSHQLVQPHNFTVTQVETDIGFQPITRCSWCNKSLREIKEQKARRFDGNHPV